ncbi:hint-domain-containing protein [Obelidium mucronatum]|nr:hint-domain-containing protein [Obelidium mucronatum]
MDDPVDVAPATAGGVRESDGLTTLDIVKHAVKTIIMSLEETDSLSIISFSDDSKIELPMTLMTRSTTAATTGVSGRMRALAVVDAMHADGSTNIWAGLDTALDVLNSVAGNVGSEASVDAILLFTDGQPNIRPPAGELAMLKKRKEKKFGGQLPCIVNTFGFGYSLDSELLNSLAVCGNGSFAFIPDAGFVGTVFVDAACNLLSSSLKSIHVKLEPQNGAQIQLCKDNTLLFGNHPVSPIVDPLAAAPAVRTSRSTRIDTAHMNDSGAELQLGSVQCGQAKDILVQVGKLPSTARTDYLKVTVSYVPLDGTGRSATASVAVSARGGGDEAVDRVAGQWCRLYAVDKIMECFDLAKAKDFAGASETIKTAIADIKKVWAKVSDAEEKRRVKELLVDLEGQVVEALLEPYFNKWGMHYLLSLSNAHRLQQCNNFKDPGVQVYQTPLFENLRDEINEIFLKLPNPKPSQRAPPPYSSSSSSSTSVARSSASNSVRAATPVRAPSPTIDMSRYYSAGRVCFSGDCFITLADKSTIPVKSLQKGIRVLSQNANHSAKVHCIVISRLDSSPVSTSSQTQLILLKNSGLIITPYHPVQRNGTWSFPCNLPDAEEYTKQDVNAVYSLILSEMECLDGDACTCGKKIQYGPSVFINGDLCAALGHGMGDDQVEESVIGHEYFACRERVLEDVIQGQGYEFGVVECQGVMRKRVGGDVSLIDGMVIV